MKKKTNISPQETAIAPNLSVKENLELIAGIYGQNMNEKAVGSVCGALLTIVAGWFAGIWFPLDLIGGVIKTISEILPFYHAAQAAAAAINGSYAEILPHIAVVLVYFVIFFGVAICVYMEKQRL